MREEFRSKGDPRHQRILQGFQLRPIVGPEGEREIPSIVYHHGLEHVPSGVSFRISAHVPKVLGDDLHRIVPV
jgi:hypothetical protein